MGNATSAPRHQALTALAAQQAGVLSRSQAVAHGATDCWLQHQVRSRRWARLHPGVYATFTGEPSWEARCWAGVLRCGSGAALGGGTALHRWAPSMNGIAASARQDDIVVVVDERRRALSGGGVDVWRLSDLHRHVHPARHPPLLRFESAVLLTASRMHTADGALAVLADGCQSRNTTPARLLRVLHELPTNLRFRSVMRDILTDVATGAYSYLEVHYLRDVERPHGLPTGSRQRRTVAGRRPYLRDVEYVGYDVVAELDGRLGHEDFFSRAHDMDRDTDTSLTGARTARIGYVQVMSRRCATAQRLADLLRLGGWARHPRRCSAGCPVV